MGGIKRWYIPAKGMTDEIVYAILGIVGGLITWLQKVLYNEIRNVAKTTKEDNANVYAIVVKLIDRMNKSDERREEIADSNDDAADRRFEKTTEKVNSIDKEIAYLKGREDGKK